MIGWIKNRIKYSSYFYYLDKFLNYRFEKERFLRYNGYKLDLKNPITFNQKVVVKKLFDRNPLLPMTADKFLVKNFVNNINGLNIIPTLYYGKNPSEINMMLLPDNFIVKGVHYSGSNLIVKGKDFITYDKIVNHCNYLLKTGIHFHSNEWLYREIEPAIIIEPLLLNEYGEIPFDFKFFVFNNKVELIQVDRDRFGEFRRCLYDSKGKIIKGGILKSSVESELDIGIELLNRAINIAENCSDGFDFVRVDLYIVGEKIYFGELTHYPGSGKSKIEPFELDLQLGKFWKLGGYYKNG